MSVFEPRDSTDSDALSVTGPNVNTALCSRDSFLLGHSSFSKSNRSEVTHSSRRLLSEHWDYDTMLGQTYSRHNERNSTSPSQLLSYQVFLLYLEW